MSESDDTDILLLIPPDLFTVASSGSEESLTNACYSTGSQVVSNLLEQVQLLENRFKGIDTSESVPKSLSMPHKLDLSTPETSKHSTSVKKCLSNLSERLQTDHFLRGSTMDPFCPNISNTLLPALDLKDSNLLGTTDFSQLLNNSSSGNSIFDRSSDQKSPKKFSRTIRDISKIQENYSKFSTTSGDLNKNYNRSFSSEGGVNTEKLLSLTDFWDPDSSKTEVEKLRIKIEEEKFRREHCEKTIQELQKRLLEQQEKVAVAIGVDKEKNTIIHQYQTLINRFKKQFQSLQSSHKKLEDSFSQSRLHHDTETKDLKKEIKGLEEQLSASRSLSQELQDKFDAGVDEKLQLLATHANELESYKSFVRKAEERYETLKMDYDKLLEKNRELEESSSISQQDLYRERLKAGEIRSEMGLIHKALDTCEAELTVLRQEKENLQLKLKEEEKRCSILEGKKTNLLEDLNSARKSEDLRNEEIKRLVEQKDQMRGELREIYQKQVDDVVKVKLKEFQAHLDTAETSFKSELEVKQRAIAECAAGKIKSIIDKHQLEINLLEEKHKEEMRLYELRLSQNVKKANYLEAKLKGQQESKSRIAEQLHSLMEKQWKQAVQIISSGNDPSFGGDENQREVRSLMKKDFGGDGCMEPVKLEVSGKRDFFYSCQEHDESLIAFRNDGEEKESKDDLKKYIKMILQMQESKNFSGTNGENESSVSSSECRQVPRKYYTKADAASTSEKTVTWQQTEPSTIYNAVSMTQVDNKSSKPPWK